MAWNQHQNQSQKIEPITDATKLRNRALYWLSKRDYSVKDFMTKLDKVCQLDELKQTLVEDFIAKDWLNEDRYMSAFVRSKIAAGLGPRRILQELQHHGIKSTEASLYLEQLEQDWFEQALRTYRRKYGDTQVQDYKEKSKRYRFMQYRGFDSEQIQYSMTYLSDDE